MLRGLYTATSAMQTNNKKLDVITNNIANIDTVGYKKDVVVSESFPETLIKKINAPMDFSNVENFSGITVKKEDNLYEVNTKGGYFRVRTPNGDSYHKDLKFTVNEDGYLSTYYKDVNGEIDTRSGYLVLGNKGPIYVGDEELEINNSGQVMIGGNIVDNLVKPVSPNTIGTLNGGVRFDRVYVNYEQGQLYETDNDLDLGIKGKGFFKVQTSAGLRYTRDGSFNLNKDKELVTLDGYKVLGIDGPIIIDGKDVSINELGEIMVDGEYVDTIQVVELENMKDLRKEASNMYRMSEGMEAKEATFTGKIVQGFLEKSNVNAVKEMVKMMSLFRNYESGQKIVKAYDDTLGKAVNEVGKV
ncbi:flagellar hook-basal body protein [Crassaminicella indica]|uniref:Flagellar hook-basal body complex protein n=1 Tax=Crassaminicella indica TaxID=2855394 RepID=A0ABX8RIF7_9CLOT|nr:flagellar hook-basal body complex protein [Crassaminicella indica]QXM06696.1 flagellar hook-basal body complex protein [Crassaminicella indica]